MLPASRFVRHVVVAKNALFTGRLVVDRRSVVLPTTCICIRYFQSEAAFHKIADHTLHTIQDAVEELLDSQEENDDYDVGNASGVLNIRIYPHGTWCINKQTPNRQIWVSEESSLVDCDQCLHASCGVCLSGIIFQLCRCAMGFF
jgi:frataxin-like iron-binding protein CyaY